MLKGDLHCHTKFSDGSMSVLNAAKTAERMKIDYLAITDHDTIESFSEVESADKCLNVNLIKGVELSSYDYERKRNVHILCYMPVNTDEIEKHCRAMCKARKECAEEMTRMVAKKYPVMFDDIKEYADGSSSVFKTHIMHALADRGFTSSIISELFYELFDPKTGSCYLSCPSPDVYDVLRMAKESGGAVSFAHPGEYNSYELLEEVCKCGLIDAIEVSHSRNREGDLERLSGLADKFGLIKTGGSDFHGFYSRSPVKIGMCTTDSDNMNRLLALIEKNTQRLRNGE